MKVNTQAAPLSAGVIIEEATEWLRTHPQARDAERGSVEAMRWQVESMLAGQTDHDQIAARQLHRDATEMRDRCLHETEDLGRNGPLQASDQRRLDSKMTAAGEADKICDRAALLFVDNHPLGDHMTTDLRSGLTPEFRQFIKSGHDGEIRAQGVATGASGGYLVPEGFRNDLVTRMKEYGGVRRVADVVTTESGNDLPFPTVDDTSNSGGILAENTQMTEQDVTLATKTLGAYMYTSKMVRVSLQLLQDSAFDLDSWLARALAERIARAQNTHFTTGTGTSQPTGIVTGATVGVTAATGGTTTVTYDNLIDLITSVDSAYWNNAKWMMNVSTLSTIRKVKDADNRPLVEPDVQAPGPGRLLGFPIEINPDMASPAASAVPLLFGDFEQGYVIRDVRQVEVLRFNERYGDYLQVGVTAFHRSDGIVRDAYAYRAFQNSAT